MTGLGNNSFSVRDGAGALFRRRALVLFTFLAVITGTILVTLLLPNRYSARMKILVKNQRVDLANALGKAVWSGRSTYHVN